MSDEHPLHDLAMAVRYDLTAAQGKLTELMRQIGEHDLPVPVGVECPHCGPGLELRGPLTLAEHLYNVHDGPEPAHYATAEERSAA